MLQLTPSDGSPFINAFSVTANNVIEGETVSVSWEVQNAGTVFLDGKVKEATGDLSIVIERSTSFTLEVRQSSGWGKIEKKTVEVALGPPAVKLEIFDQTVYLSSDGFALAPCEMVFVKRWELIEKIPGKPAGIGKVIAFGENSAREMCWKPEIIISLKKPSSVFLRVFNGRQSSDSPLIAVKIRRPEIILFDVDRRLVTRGGKVTVSWETLNAKKVELNNGIGEVAPEGAYPLQVPSDNEFRVRIRVTGEYNQVTEQEITVYVARIISMFSSDNGDYRNPSFYLNWDSEYFDSLLLQPGNVVVPSRSDSYPIPAIEGPVTYSLTGLLGDFSDSILLPLKPARISEFKMLENGAIVNTEAHLKWTVEEGQRILLDPLIDTSPGPGGAAFFVTEKTRRIRRVVWGGANVVQREIEIDKLRVPLITSVKCMLPEVAHSLTLKGIPIQLAPFLQKLSSRGYNGLRDIGGVRPGISIKKFGLPSTLLLKLRKVIKIKFALKRIGRGQIQNNQKSEYAR